MSQYTIGIDFGTLSARGILLNLQTAEETAVCEKAYAHGVMDDALPDGTKLGRGWALQHPEDYDDCLLFLIRELLKTPGIRNTDIVGIGIDFTASTVLPVDEAYAPLCRREEFRHHPHAYAKLWKHHAAQYCADLINDAAEIYDKELFRHYGGKISCEWLLPKALQTAKEAPEIYARAHRIMEAADWIVFQMTGAETGSACCAGYKAGWNEKDGYYKQEFLKKIDPRIEDLGDKLTRNVLPVGTRAGFVSRAFAERSGLDPSCAVAVPIIDAHASLPACGIDGEGKMLIIMGTSSCHLILSRQKLAIDGICGVVKDGILPGYYAYEAGQSCVGDSFAWYVQNCLPKSYWEQAERKQTGIHAYLREKARRLKPGESGLLSLDWLGGVRSTLMDFDLSGLILGLTIQTKPEEIYRCLIEGTAFGTRTILEAFENGGLPTGTLFAAGGIADKDPMTLQIYADICGKEIRLSKSRNSGALGSAILGALAAGPGVSGFRDAADAVRALGAVKDTVVRPIEENRRIYDRLYAEYRTLYEYFSKTNRVMKNLRQITAGENFPDSPKTY